MANTIIPLTPPTFPPGYCFPATPQQLFADAVSFGAEIVVPPTLSGSIISPTQPAASSRNLVWYKVDPNTNALLGTFTFSPTYNLWIQPHRIAAGDVTQKRIYVDGAAIATTLVNLRSYDGGDGGTNGSVTDTTGPMWIQDTSWSNGTTIGHVPMGVPSSVFAMTNTGTIVNTNLATATSAVAVHGCIFIIRSARIFLVGT